MANALKIGILPVVLFGIFFLLSDAVASDCSGGWRKLSNYRPGQGGPCAMLGLNSNRGVCRPGDRFETYCDDRSGGEYRTCQGPRRCQDNRGRDRDNRSGNYEKPYRRDRDHRSDSYENYNRRENSYSDRRCRNWDYHYNSPCPPGFYNDDCRGSCESRMEQRR